MIGEQSDEKKRFRDQEDLLMNYLQSQPQLRFSVNYLSPFNVESPIAFTQLT